MSGAGAKDRVASSKIAAEGARGGAKVGHGAFSSAEMLKLECNSAAAIRQTLARTSAMGYLVHA
jgi:hypothetical protein